MKASARKSFGEFKPVILHDSGRTEICGQRGYIERIVPQTKHYQGPTEVYHAQRGKTFKTREEAVAYAQKDIDFRVASRAKADAEYQERQARYAAQAAQRSTS